MQVTVWRGIADEITRRIVSGELPPGTKIESESEMAERLGVSRHTVHKAIHELQREGLVVRQRRWGTVVAERPRLKKHRIGYVVDFTTNQFQTQLLSHIELALREGDRLLVATSRNDPVLEAQHLRSLLSEVDGLIVYPAEGDENAALFKEIQAKGFPVVLIDRAPRGCEDMVVLTDNVLSSELAVKCLSERGCHRIAFFGNSNDRAMSNRERRVGYEQAVESIDPRLERWIHMSLEDNSESMYQAVNDALVTMRLKFPDLDGAFCTQDWLAQALIVACNAEGLEVGANFKIATFNDFGEGFFRYPRRLIRVRQQVDRISLTAMQRLYSLFDQIPVPGGPIRISATIAPFADREFSAA